MPLIDCRRAGSWLSAAQLAEIHVERSIFDLYIRINGDGNSDGLCPARQLGCLKSRYSRQHIGECAPIGV
jgi:hypothetical protein